jgi:cytoskeleton-associated protein 5
LFLYFVLTYQEIAVTSGTLDAIIERMRSMQLAAAAENQDAGSRPLMSMNDNLNHGFSSQIPHKKAVINR